MFGNKWQKCTTMYLRDSISLMKRSNILKCVGFVMLVSKVVLIEFGEKFVQVALSISLFYEKSQEQKKPEFLEKYKKRSAQEWKNGEMKRFHGLSRARGWGLRSILFQAKLTAIAVNLKRISAITGKETLPVIAFFKKVSDFFKNFILNTDFATIFLLTNC